MSELQTEQWNEVLILDGPRSIYGSNGVIELLKDTVRLADEQVGQFMSGAIFFQRCRTCFL